MCHLIDIMAEVLAYLVCMNKIKGFGRTVNPVYYRLLVYRSLLYLDIQSQICFLEYYRLEKSVFLPCPFKRKLLPDRNLKSNIK
jgi:hypothetical protein